MQENYQRELGVGGETSWLGMGWAEGFFMFSWGGQGVLGPISVGDVPPLPSMTYDSSLER